MKQITNPHGLRYSASAEDSVEQMDQIVRSYTGFRTDIGKRMKALLGADADMPMAICMKGYIAKLIGSANHSLRANAISRQLNDLLSSKQYGAEFGNSRERLHANALAAWCEGDLDGATGFWETILRDEPLDGLALRLAHLTHFYSGNAQRIRDSLARVLPQWPKNNPEYGFVLGMYAFGLEESGEFIKAEKVGRQAVELNPEDSWSVHAVAHVMEMTERHAEGVSWIEGLESGWSKVNNFRFHLYWHQCLYHLELGDTDQVLHLYDTQVSSDLEAEFNLDVCNAASLLWRLEMHGIDVGARWQRVAEVARGHVEDQDLIFVSLHYLMASIGAGDRTAVTTMMENLKKWSVKNNNQGEITQSVGIRLASALQHARKGEYRMVVDLLNESRYSMNKIGGSQAQRDIFTMLMLDAARKGGFNTEFRQLFAERVAYKPNSSWSWQGYAEALDAAGENALAEQALESANGIRCR